MEPRKHYFAKIPTIAIFIVMAMSGPLGVLLFILKGIDQKVMKEEQEACPRPGRLTRADLEPALRPGRSEPVHGHGYAHRGAEKRQAMAQEHCHPLHHHGCGLSACRRDECGGSSWRSWRLIPGLQRRCSPNIAMAIGGGGALLTGLRMNSTRKLERLLDKVVGERDNIPLPELFAAAGVDAARGRAAVNSAIEHGYFGADAYIDNRTDTLVVRGAAPQPKKPAPAPAPKPQPAAEDEYAALLRQLREVNDAIPDPVMSQKISRLEEVSGRIFALAQKDPDKKAQLQKFMNYYLPTALKLLNTYASLSRQAVEGTNITEAKHSIERSMDLLVTAFENQLDKLFQSDALDVTTDIAALEGMLNMDGLTDSAFGK